ncbi:MotA/TolQ/ExbB proton channel family protein [Phaeobacter sp. NW0010-22]|uniref:MotA/TolQ/ExbB proton channel family protein n=1 Tax=Phaeobacter sp. NW0010-22 TaxID=3135907 RepID=UPI00310B5E39
MDKIASALRGILDLGGPVVAVLILTSIITLTVVFYKLWQYRAAGVGRHVELNLAVQAWDRGDKALTERHLNKSRSYLVPVIKMGLNGNCPELSERTDAEAEERFSRLERGLSALDMVAQLAPLMGLFGTVLGMIEAFQKLQSAGSSVDPSLLAGGIWVALLTTAAGLAVAMPTSLILSWLEARMHQERVFTNRVLRTLFAPGHSMVESKQTLHSTDLASHGA